MKSWQIGVAVLFAAQTGLLLPRLSAAEPSRTLTIDFAQEQGRVEPRTGFLGVLRLTLARVEANQAYRLQLSR